MNGNRSIRLRRIGPVLLALTFLALVSGCYERAVHGDESVYKTESWVGIVVTIAGVVGVPIGFLIRRWNFRLAFVLMGIGPFVILALVPAMYLDRVVVDANHFEGRYGLWFDPTRFNISFDDLKEIQYVEVQGNDSISHEMHCVRKNGTTEIIHAGDLVSNAVLEILTRAETKGVKVIDKVP